MSERRWSAAPMFRGFALRRGADKVGRPRKPGALSAGWGPKRWWMQRRVLRKARRLKGLEDGHLAPQPLAPSDRSYPALLAIAVEAVRRRCGARASADDIAAALDLVDGTVTEHGTPQGRQLALTLAAGAMAMRGNTIRMVCLSEVRAKTLHDLYGPAFDLLGLSNALICNSARIDERQKAYKARIVIASAARLTQDTLRDFELLGVTGGGLRSRPRSLRDGDNTGRLVRPASVALIDDADLVMVEAPRPVGIGSDIEDAAGRLRAEEAFVILRGLQAGTHYAIDPLTRRIRLTDRGEDRLDTFATLFEGPWMQRRWREETIFSALTIREFFKPGRDYRIDGGEIIMDWPAQRRELEPSMLDLIAAKEKVEPRPTPTRLSSYRRFLLGFDHLAGTGFGLGYLTQDVQQSFGLSCRGATMPQTPVTPRFVRNAEERRQEVAQLAGPDVVLWAPTEEDAKAFRSPPEGAKLVVGEAIFSLASPPRMIVQLAAAQSGWEARLLDAHPEAHVIAFADAGDGIFRILGDQPPGLYHFRSDPGAAAYRLAQEERGRVSAARRAAHLKSEQYFERILAFAGDSP